MDACFVKKTSDLLVLQQRCIGYPANLAYDYTDLVISNPNLFACKFNNIGPLDKPSAYAIHCKDVEKKVLDYFCSLWNFDPANVWGYVTNSGTEGNEQALYIARELYPNAILYFSKDSHYSIKKLAKILCMQYEEVDALENGQMNLQSFEDAVKRNIDRSVIVNANLGTTMKGAYDDTREISRILRKHKKDHDCFVHADAALMGAVVPLFQNDIYFTRYIDSLSISGHKFFGVPFPCGIFLLDTSHRSLKKRRLDSITTYVEYIDCTDCTISGSRSGVAPLFLQYIIEKKGRDGFTQDVHQCIENAEYLVDKLNDLNKDLDAWRNHNSLTVLFRKPPKCVIDKWQLASEKDIAHVVVLPHVTKKVIDDFVNDLLDSDIMEKVPQSD